MNIRDVRIVVCPRCQGFGQLESATGDKQRYKYIDCPECGGKRVLERTVSINYKRVEDADESQKECPSLEPSGAGQ